MPTCSRTHRVWPMVALLTACAATPGPAPERAGTDPPAAASGAPPPAAAPSRPAAERPLAQEAEWLRSWFQGTPVRVVSPADGSVTVWVPPPHAFSEPIQPEPLKPGLKAVLDRVAQSLQRQARSTVQVQAGVPAARAMAVQRHLAGRGVAAARIQVLAAAQGVAPEGVQLRLLPGAQAVRELRDEQLPRPQPGMVRPPAVRPPGG